MAKTLVIQSHRLPLSSSWIRECVESVREWAHRQGACYRLLGDELFDSLSDEQRGLINNQTVVAADLARLHALREALDEGFATAVWLDADFFIFDPERFVLPDSQFTVGREVWIQWDHQTPRAYVKVHNAFLMFKRGNPFLDFYIHAATRLLALHEGPMSPQFIGPKLLSAIHNIVSLPVAECAGMLSPAVIEDFLEGEGPALNLFREKSVEPPAGVNLCSSLVVRGDVNVRQIEAAMARLKARREI